MIFNIFSKLNIVSKNKKNNNEVQRRYFVINENTPFIVKEAYNSMRTNLLSVMSVYGDAPKHICFTSTEMGDGKTLSCVNVAATFAETGAKVLIIDADMRKPRLHTVFKIKSAPGLSDCLGRFCTSSKAIVKSNKVNNLYLLPAGKLPPNPSELILSDSFNELLSSLTEEFDYVFIDAPPVGLVTDATIISKKTLGAVLVCKYNSTNMESAKKASNEIKQGGGNVLGSVLNGVEYTKYSKYSSGSGKYGYYESYGENK